MKIVQIFAFICALWPYLRLSEAGAVPLRQRRVSSPSAEYSLLFLLDTYTDPDMACDFSNVTVELHYKHVDVNGWISLQSFSFVSPGRYATMYHAMGVSINWTELLDCKCGFKGHY